MYIHTYNHTHTYTYIYIILYREREGERERVKYLWGVAHVLRVWFLYLFIYLCMHVWYNNDYIYMRYASTHTQTHRRILYMCISYTGASCTLHQITCIEICIRQVTAAEKSMKRPGLFILLGTYCSAVAGAGLLAWLSVADFTLSEGVSWELRTHTSGWWRHPKLYSAKFANA